MNICILLPYKENFSPSYPGAVSLFVNSTSNISRYKKNIIVYGNTQLKEKFSQNYVNIPLSKNTLFKSQSKEYVNKFGTLIKSKKIDILEIHNRPNYIKLIKNINTKIVLYFHNDPLTMTGSRSEKDRKLLLDQCTKIIFNSHWSRKRFLEGIEGLHINSEKMEVIYQSTYPIKVENDKVYIKIS